MRLLVFISYMVMCAMFIKKWNDEGRRRPILLVFSTVWFLIAMVTLLFINKPWLLV